MLDLVRRWMDYDLAPVSPDATRLLDDVKAQLPSSVNVQTFEFPSGTMHNGWVVPDSWTPKHVRIEDVTPSEKPWLAPVHTGGPVVPAGYSKPFQGEVLGKALKEHVFTHATLVDATPYHCDWYYKPHLRDWGIVMPANRKIALRDNALYKVDVAVDTGPGVMQVLDATLHGEHLNTIVIQAYNCHPHQANDNLSGIVVGLEVMKRLAERDRLRFSYQFLVGPELFSTIFLSSVQPQGAVEGVIGLLLVGNNGPLKVQQSFWGTADIDLVAEAATSMEAMHEFRTLVGSDETVWAAPGIEKPRVSLTRMPYDAYHAMWADSEKKLSLDALEDTVRVVMRMVEVLETNFTAHPNFDGLVSLSAPQYGLHFSPGTDPSRADAGAAQWHKLMNGLPQCMAKGMSVLEIALRYRLPFEEVRDYVLKWFEKGLVNIG